MPFALRLLKFRPISQKKTWPFQGPGARCRAETGPGPSGEAGSAGTAEGSAPGLSGTRLLLGDAVDAAAADQDRAGRDLYQPASQIQGCAGWLFPMPHH